MSEKPTWNATFITAKPSQSTQPKRPIRFKKSFSLASFPRTSFKATLNITSLGVYEAYLNNERVGDHVLAPGWTTYDHRLHYQTFDVSHLCLPELNTLAIEVAEGWYGGRLGWGEGKNAPYGHDLSVLAQLDLRDSDGGLLGSIVSDSSWQWSLSAIISSGIYDGEIYDLREEHGVWTSSSSGHGWSNCIETPMTTNILTTPESPPVRAIERLEPDSITMLTDGRILVDFGQNIAGVVEICDVKVAEGRTITVRHAEVIQNDEVYVRPLRTAKATDTIVSNGETIVKWSPKYTFHGFRYAEITGWSPEDACTPLFTDRINAIVLHTDMRRTGHFSCSNDLINKLHENVVWSMRGNFLSIPTDCPQRNERLGWTGDIQVFAPTANFLYDTSGILSDWLKDLACDQTANGGIVPCVVPNILQGHEFSTKPQACWSDAAILVPWSLYMTYGNASILRQQYDSMKLYLKSGVARGSDDLWLGSHWQLGDWLDPTAPSHKPGLARTDGVLVADAYLVHVTGVIANISGILGEHQDQEQYQTQHETLKQRFQNKYMTATGLVVSDSQTAISLVLCFNLYRNQSQARMLANRLRITVEQLNWLVSTGFVGTPLILHALSSFGHADAAYRMLLETQCPSWLYPVTMGATTVWERWDSMLPDGTVHPGQMTSFNHYALGSVANWLHTTVGGISPLKPGWSEILVRPVPGGTITSAEVSFECGPGRISCSWKLDAEMRFEMELEVPVGAKAKVILPRSDSEVGEERVDGDGEDLWLGPGIHKLSCTCDYLKKWPPERLDNSWIEHSS